MERDVLVYFNADSAKEFKNLYEGKVASGASDDDTFMFGDHLYLVGFAKYLIEYMEMNGYYDE